MMLNQPRKMLLWELSFEQRAFPLPATVPDELSLKFINYVFSGKGQRIVKEKALFLYNRNLINYNYEKEYILR